MAAENDGLPPPLKPGEKPLFCTPDKLSQEYPGVYRGPVEKPVFDEELPPAGTTDAPDAKTLARYRKIARLTAVGIAPQVIAQKLGYSASRIGEVLTLPVVQKEIADYRAQLLDEDIPALLKDVGADAVQAVRDFINDPLAKSKDRAETAKWLIEKLTGKARQEVDIDSSSLTGFMTILKQMSRGGEQLNPGNTLRDVTPAQIIEADTLPSGAAVTRNDDPDIDSFLSKF